MTVLSLPFVASYIANGLVTTYENAQAGRRADLARVGTIVFGVYLVADVSVTSFLKTRRSSQRVADMLTSSWPSGMSSIDSRSAF